MSLSLPKSIADEIIAHARRETPHECCGFLAGKNGTATHRFPLMNVADTPQTRFESSPGSTFVAMKEMRQLGVELLAVYHSHPLTPPIPSVTDRNLNYSSPVANVIVSLATEPPTLRGWRIDGDQVVEIGIN
jgi:proteasome lid subunit RPN8/RPN11